MCLCFYLCILWRPILCALNSRFLLGHCSLSSHIMKPIARRIVILGGSSGVGSSIARIAAARGHKLFLTGRRLQALEAVAQDVKKAGSIVSFDVGDVGNEQDVKRLTEKAIHDLGAIDVLIANAGMGRGRGSVEQTSIADFDEMFRTNVRGPYLWMREVIPHMKKNKFGQIIAISSALGLMANAPNAALYTSTKHALEGMMGCTRKSLEGTGVKVGVINPYAINTPWWTDYQRGGVKKPMSEEDRSRMLDADDVARAVLSMVEQSDMNDIERIIIEAKRLPKIQKQKP